MTACRVLSKEAQQRIRRLKADGWSAEALAALYGISRRSVYRYLEGALVDVEVAGYATTYLVQTDRSPVRAAPWRKL